MTCAGCVWLCEDGDSYCTRRDLAAGGGQGNATLTFLKTPNYGCDRKESVGTNPSGEKIAVFGAVHFLMPGGFEV